MSDRSPTNAEEAGVFYIAALSVMCYRGENFFGNILCKVSKYHPFHGLDRKKARLLKILYTVYAICLLTLLK